MACQPPWAWAGHQPPDGERCDPPPPCLPSLAVPPPAGAPNALVMRDQMAVGLLSHGIMSPGGSTPLRPVTGWPSLPPSSFTSQPLRLPLRFAFPGGETTGLPRSACVPGWVRPRLSAGACPVCGREVRDPLHPPRTFGFKPLSIFGLSSVTAFISGSRPLVLPAALAPAPPEAGSRDPSSRSDHHPVG